VRDHGVHAISHENFLFRFSISNHRQVSTAPFSRDNCYLYLPKVTVSPDDEFSGLVCLVYVLRQILGDWQR